MVGEFVEVNVAAMEWMRGIVNRNEIGEEWNWVRLYMVLPAIVGFF